MIVGMGIVLGVLFGLMLLAVVAVVMNVCRYFVKVYTYECEKL